MQITAEQKKLGVIFSKDKKRNSKKIYIHEDLNQHPADLPKQLIPLYY
jgi:hypothetical protein